MFLGYQNNKIKYYVEQPLNSSIYNVDRWEETYEEYVLDGDEYVIKDEAWEEEQAKKRKQAFLKDFFKVGDYGYYRRQPKGYQSAVESMNVLFNIANVSKGLQGGLIIFYEEPDFTDPKQCTEEWLVAHQIIMEAMSLQDFLSLYVDFMTAWNTEEHETIEPEPQSDDELIEKPEEEEEIEE